MPTVYFRHLCTLPAFLFCEALTANTLEESYLASSEAGVTIEASYTHFNQDLDAIGYLDSLPAGARPEQYERAKLDIGYKFDSWRPFLIYEQIDGSVTRPTRPFEVASDADYKSIGITYSVGSEDRGGSAVISLSSAIQSNVVIDCYERSGVVLGGSCSEADFQLVDGDALLETGESLAFPVLTSSAEALTAELSLHWWRRWSRHPVLIGHHLMVKASEVDHDSYSPLYDLKSSFLLNTPFNGVPLGDLISDLKDDLPQSEPWREGVFSYNVSASLFTGNWVLGGSLGAIYAERYSFADPMQRPQYNTNFKVSGHVWYQFKHAAIYLKGEALTNYLLGVDPLAYTSKSSRFFEHPYGQISVGFIATL